MGGPENELSNFTIEKCKKKYIVTDVKIIFPPFALSTMITEMAFGCGELGQFAFVCMIFFVTAILPKQV